MDIPMGNDLFESFIQYQSRVIAELDRLAETDNFQTIDATRPKEEVSNFLNERVTELLSSSSALRAGT
jgi:dTMP kinase